jgi:hypothetical protein
MCARLDSTNMTDGNGVTLMSDRHDNSMPEDPQPPQDVKSAMADLRSALLGRKIERICAAYQQLRLAASTLSAAQRCKMVGELIGPLAMTMIVSAHSHRQCYMCADGTIPCETCLGTGEMSPGRTCPNCDGLAAMTCGFCRGTNWADRETVPGEIRAIVSRRQRDHVQRDLPALAKMVAQLTAQAAAATPLKSRQEIARWLLRFSGRLAVVATSRDTPQDQQENFSQFAAQADNLLEMLRDL